jgi:hypothetical protein
VTSGPDRRSGASESSSGGKLASDRIAQTSSTPSTPLVIRRDRRMSARVLRRQLDARYGGEHCGEQQADRRRHREARVGRFEHHARCRERVEAEEAGRGEERERHEVHARVPTSRGRGDHRVGDHGVDHRGAEHEPQMRGMVLPTPVERRPRDEQEQPDQRQRDETRENAVP